MEYIERATLSPKKKKRNIIKITIVSAVCLVGVLFAGYSVHTGDYLYGILYLLAVISGLMYVIIKINAVMPSYIAVSRESVYIQCWDNGIFPYRTNFKPAFFADFIPAKVIKNEIPIKDIKSIFVGNKTFLMRNLEGTSFLEDITKVISHRKSDGLAARKMDFICVVDKADRVSYMSLNDIDFDVLGRVINFIYRKNPQTIIKCNLKDLRNRLTIQKGEDDYAKN